MGLVYYNYRYYNTVCFSWLSRDFGGIDIGNLYTYVRNIFAYDFLGLTANNVEYRGVYRTEGNVTDGATGLTCIRVEIDVELTKSEYSTCAELKVKSFWIYRIIEPKNSNKYRLDINDPNVIQFVNKIKEKSKRTGIPPKVLDYLYNNMPGTYEGCKIHEEEHIEELEALKGKIKTKLEAPSGQTCWKEMNTSENYKRLMEFYNGYLTSLKSKNYPEGIDPPTMFDLTSILPNQQESERRATNVEWQYYINTIR